MLVRLPSPTEVKTASHTGVPQVRRLHQIFELTCDLKPDAVAVEAGGVALTYAELDRRANQLAHHLRGRGVRGGARIAILLHRSIETYVCLLAIGKAGAAFVPIDPASPADRMRLR